MLFCSLAVASPVMAHQPVVLLVRYVGETSNQPANL